MDTQIVVVFCLCDDLLKAMQHHEDSQRQMTDAEVMTTAIVAMLYFKGNFRLASQYMCECTSSEHLGHIEQFAKVWFPG